MLFVDHQTLEKIIDSGNEYPNNQEFEAFREKIKEKVHELDEIHRQVIIMYFFENLSPDEIAGELDLNDFQVHKIFNEAMLILKHSLAETVQKRWPDRFKDLNTCPVCSHPKKHLIEKIIKNKKKNESWRSLNNRLKKKTGRSFNPPLILINHLNYHTKG